MRELSKEVLSVLSGLEYSRRSGLTWYVSIPQQLERGLYVKVNEALQAAGGKWSRTDKAHVFDGDAEAAIDDIIIAGGFVDAKRDFGFFETPPELARRLVDLAEISFQHNVLEPSAGKGAIANEIRHRGNKAPWCIEILPANQAELMQQDFPLIHDDFLTFEDPDGFDRIVMNPPFARQADIDHVTHALKLLKPGGKLVAVMAAGVRFRQNKKTSDFCRLIYDFEKSGTAQWIDNPPGSFAESGTDVNTITLVVSR